MNFNKLIDKEINIYWLDDLAQLLFSKDDIDCFKKFNDDNPHIFVYIKYDNEERAFNFLCEMIDNKFPNVNYFIIKKYSSWCKVSGYEIYFFNKETKK